MLQKISREDCLQKYPVFPLRHYNKVTDEENFFYPQVILGKWMELGIDQDDTFSTKLAQELTSLITALGVESLIFLGDTEQYWISKQGSKRKGYLPFTKAVDYFIQHRIDTTFNGGIIVGKEELDTFINHFYTLVQCDASLPYFHFIDNNQLFLGTIHYSGQIRIDSFNEQAYQLLESQLAGTEFRVVAN